MSMSHDTGAVLYVVSRSGKVLGSEDRSRRCAQDEYFEGELEGWIFWGSKRTSGSSGSKRVAQEASPSHSNGKSFLGGSFEGLGWTSRKKRIPFVAWGDEIASLNDIITPLTRRHPRSQQRRSLSRKEFSQGRRLGEGRMDGDTEFDSSVSGSARSQAMSCHSDRWDRMEQNLKIGLAQLAILHKWEAGTRELAARWVAWLLKMLRKARPHPRPLQHHLFTMCSAVLPVICRSLARECWTRSPDPEIYRCVDIFWKALEKSGNCFSPIQWEILEEKMDECRKLRLKIASPLQTKRAAIDASDGQQESFGSKPKEQQESGGGLLDAPWLPSEDVRDLETHSDSKDENLSNSLVQNEGVLALVKRALREKLFTPRAKSQEGRVSGEVSGGPGTIVSLMCPLSGSRVKVPARGRGCSHRASFDLQAYLEVRAKDEISRKSATHLRKKQKTETTWCCPICGSDATWPQIIVDRVLLRILEVLPENMPQVCLLPNGRWRVVWSPVVEGVGKTDSGSRKRSAQFLTRYGVNTETRNPAKPWELNRDAVKESRPCSTETGELCGCETEWQALDRAFRSWKEGIEVLSKDGVASRQRDVQGGRKTSVASRDGDQKLKVDASSAVCSERKPESAETTVKLAGGGTHASGSTSTQARSMPPTEELPSLFGGLGKVSKSAENTRDNVTIRTAQHGNMVVEALIGTAFVSGETGGMYSRMRVGQHKARRKQMAKKT